jgi:hypothetical protein
VLYTTDYPDGRPAADIPLAHRAALITSQSIL